jgi:hypothetical protein
MIRSMSTMRTKDQHSHREDCNDKEVTTNANTNTIKTKLTYLNTIWKYKKR